MAKSLSPSKKRISHRIGAKKSPQILQSCKWSTITSPACPHRKYLVDFLCTVPLLKFHRSRAVFLSIPSSCREFIRQFDGTEAVASSRLLHIPSFSLPSPLSPFSLSPSHLNGCIMELGGVEITSVIATADADSAALPRNPVQPASERVPRGEGRIGYTPPLTKRGVYRCPAPPSLGPAPPGRQSPRGSD